MRQETEAVVNDGVMEKVPYMVDELFSVLAERFGSTGAHLWEVMVTQAYVGAIGNLLGFVFVVLLWSSLSFVSYRFYVKTEDEDFLGVFVSVSIISLLITSLFVMFGTTSIISRLFNPEYWALEQVFNLLP